MNTAVALNSVIPAGGTGNHHLFDVVGGLVVIRGLIGRVATELSTTGSGYFSASLTGTVSLSGSATVPVGKLILPTGVASPESWTAWSPSPYLIGDGGYVGIIAYDDGVDGAVDWTLYYEQLDPGAFVQAA